jgi:hypothetical protein
MYNGDVCSVVTAVRVMASWVDDLVLNRTTSPPGEDHLVSAASVSVL